MPRTKRPVRKQEKPAVDDEALKKLDKLGLERKAILDSCAKNQCMEVEFAFKMLLSSIREEDLQKTIGQLKAELYINEAQATNRRTTRSSRAASHDDGYLTEASQGSGDKGGKKNNTTVSSTSSRDQTVRRSRSAVGRKPPATITKTIRRRSKSVYKTPCYNKNPLVNYPPITPKVMPDTPLTMLRQPRQGEMVVSMSGSPVMVPSCYTMRPEEQANCNILLKDGTMLSLQPKQLRQSQAYIPFTLMDPGVISQLKTLKDNLSKMVKLGETVFK